MRITVRNVHRKGTRCFARILVKTTQSCQISSNPNPNGYIHISAKSGSGDAYDILAPNRKEGGFSSCIGHSRNLSLRKSKRALGFMGMSPSLTNPNCSDFCSDVQILAIEKF
jgi:hypothetical protein